jgi:hypothetical protein
VQVVGYDALLVGTPKSWVDPRDVT